MHYLSWKDNFEVISKFRKELKANFNFPIKLEMHTKHFLLDKSPYREFNFSHDDKKQIFTLFCQMISKLDLKVINTVIVKPKLASKNYNVLDGSLTYSIQRIENDLKSNTDPNVRFIIITDPGRVGKMRKTTRKIQKINYIPSRYAASKYRKEIKFLIEDPLPKDSKESYYIQISDLISYIISLYSLMHLGIGDLPNRLKSYANYDSVKEWMDLLKPAFNLKAATGDEFGIVYHPK